MRYIILLLCFILVSPTVNSTNAPTVAPTTSPTTSPSISPTNSPTNSPTVTCYNITNDVSCLGTNDDTLLGGDAVDGIPNAYNYTHLDECWNRCLTGPICKGYTVREDIKYCYFHDEIFDTASLAGYKCAKRLLSCTPTPEPTNSPSISPTMSPTFSPTMNSTNAPTDAPTVSPTTSPTVNSTNAPTMSPTFSVRFELITATSCAPGSFLSTEIVDSHELCETGCLGNSNCKFFFLEDLSDSYGPGWASCIYYDNCGLINDAVRETIA